MKTLLLGLMFASAAMAQPIASYPWTTTPTPTYASSAAAPPCTATTSGSIYYDTGLSTLQVCNGTWGAVSSPSGPYANSTALMAPLNLYVASSADGGLATLADGGLSQCTFASPCSSIQRACDIVPNDICDVASIWVTSDYSGVGCRKEGIRRCNHAAGDGGVTSGIFLISGTAKQYAPADAGTGTGLISLVTTGNGSSQVRDIWKVANGAYNPNELPGSWIQITSGTGSGTDKKWPIFDNDAGVMRIQSTAQATAPAVGSGYTLYSKPGTTITGNLAQTVLKGGIDEATLGAAFVISAQESASSYASDPWVRIQNFYHTGAGGTGTGVFAAVGGPIDIRECYTDGSGSFARALVGSTLPTIERTIGTGSAGALYVGANSQLGVTNNARFFNNWSNGSNSSLSASVIGTMISQQNYLPNGGLILNSCADCRSFDDTFGYIQTGASFQGNQASGGAITVDSDILGPNSSVVNTLDLSGKLQVFVDTLLGSTTITAGTAGHLGQLRFGASLAIGGGTVLTAGSGTADFAFRTSAGTVTGAALRAMTSQRVCVDGDTCIRGVQTTDVGSPLTGLADVSSATAVFAGALDHGASAMIAGTKVVTLNYTFSAAPVFCWCNDSVSTAGTPVGCAWVTPATTTTATFDGVGTDAFTWGCLGAR